MFGLITKFHNFTDEESKNKSLHDNDANYRIKQKNQASLWLLQEYFSP